jgi:hypothetical protein
MSTKINIIVNGVKRQVESGNLSYEEIVTLAHGKFIPYMTVVYFWKDKQSDVQRSGILHTGKGVELAEGMVFSAMHTGNA